MFVGRGRSHKEISGWVISNDIPKKVFMLAIFIFLLKSSFKFYLSVNFKYELRFMEIWNCEIAGCGANRVSNIRDLTLTIP